MKLFSTIVMLLSVPFRGPTRSWTHLGHILSIKAHTIANPVQLEKPQAHFRNKTSKYQFYIPSEYLSSRVLLPSE